jgi:hypothetical protein
MDNMNEDFKKFEDSLNDKIVNTDITYTQDRAIEADVKYRYLIDRFGKENVDLLVEDFLILADHAKFLSVDDRLKEKLKSE